MGVFDGVKAIRTDGREVEIETVFVEGKNKHCTTIEVKLLEDACLREIKVFEGWHKFKKQTKYFGEGYQMLSEYGNILKKIKSLTAFTDATHYKMPTTPKMRTAYNYVYLIDDIKKRRKKKHKALFVGATTCNRFRTEIRINKMMITVSQIMENINYSAGDVIRLEELFFAESKTIEPLLEKYGDSIRNNYEPKTYKEMPSGWCSWYCIGPDATEEQIFQNLTLINGKIPKLKYIQIDDGYQPSMGDWLDDSSRFTSGAASACKEIKSAGLEPAIWLAPFISSGNSKLIKEHPEYFIMDDFGSPLSSAAVSFGGWRDAPWYMLDPTNPDAINYIKMVVKTMHDEWGVKYFKLDANMWGAMPFGKRHDEKATSVEAYRRGMEAIWEAVNNDAFILGCNAPLFPSLGLVNAMRVTDDVKFNIGHASKMAKNCFERNWMNGKLWINDPDCIILHETDCDVMRIKSDKPITKKYKKQNRKFFKFNNIFVRASGGLVMASDIIDQYSQVDIERLERIIDSPRMAAKFDAKRQIGILEYDNKKEYCLFCHDKKLKVKIDIANVKRVINMYDNKTIPYQKNIKIKLKKYDAKWIMVEYNK